MSQVYPPPTPSSSRINNHTYTPFTPRPTPSSPLKPPTPSALYAQASQAFLGRDFLKAAISLHLARPPTPSPPDEWFRLTQAPEGERDGARWDALALERRVAVLEVTLLATATGTAEAGSVPWPGRFAKLSTLGPKQLLEALWADLTGDSSSHPPEILPSSSAGFMHPSLASTLVLAALKLDQPRSARAIAEAWFGSVSTEVDDLVAATAARTDWAELPVAGQGAVGSSQVLRAPGLRPDLAQQLVGAWVKLHDLMCLQVLPRVGEWEAAADAVRGQAEENGGFIPQERVEVSSGADPVGRSVLSVFVLTLVVRAWTGRPSLPGKVPAGARPRRGRPDPARARRRTWQSLSRCGCCLGPVVVQAAHRQGKGETQG